MDAIPTLTWSGFQTLGRVYGQTPESRLVTRNGVYAAYYLALKCPLCGLALPETCIYRHVSSCMQTPDHKGLNFDYGEWHKTVNRNSELPPKKVFHRNLERVAESEHKSICPECGSVLLMRRLPNFQISTKDNCILCGRQYHYVDIVENMTELTYKEGHALMEAVLKHDETGDGSAPIPQVSDPGGV